MQDVQVKLAQNDAVSSPGCSSSREIPEKLHGSKLWELQEAGQREWLEENQSDQKTDDTYSHWRTGGMLW